MSNPIIPQNDGKKTDETLKKSERLWKTAGDQYTIISNHLIFKKHELGITDAEFHVILILAAHKHADENPWPSLRTLCICRWGEYNPVKRRSMNLVLESLEKKSLIYKIARKTDKGQQSNSYDLSPLVDRLTQIIDQQLTGDEAELHGGDVVELQGGDVNELHPGDEAELHPKKKREKEKEKRKIEKETTTGHMQYKEQDRDSETIEENVRGGGKDDLKNIISFSEGKKKEYKLKPETKLKLVNKITECTLFDDQEKTDLVLQVGKSIFNLKQVEAHINQKKIAVH